MTISSPGLRGVLQAYRGQQVATSEKRRSEQTAGGSADEVILSPKARELKRAQEIVAMSSAVREEKVEQLTREVAAGTYWVNPEAVAEKLLQVPGILDREV